jgi:hypothetical protein
MTSAHSRWSQPPEAAISDWNGSTGAVHAIAIDPLWDTRSIQFGVGRWTASMTTTLTGPRVASSFKPS